MAYTVIASTSFKQTGTTAAINTTGADLIIVAFAIYNGNTHPPSFSDSAGNTWPSPFLSTIETTRGNGQFGYMIALSNPTTSATHTFTNSSNANSSFAVLAVSGSAASPLDQTNSTLYVTGSPTSEPTGSVTPTQNNELCVAAYCIDTPAGSTFSVSGYTIQQQIDMVANSYFGIVLATNIQTTATATNPTLSRSALTGGDIAMVATFKAAGSGGSSGPNNQYDWPNPVQPFRQEQTWVQRLRPPQPVHNPFIQTDWPLTPAPQPIQQTWIQHLQPPQPVHNPFIQTSWPNPYPVQWYQSWTQSPNVPRFPFNQYDWPTPYPVQWDRYWSQSLRPPQPVHNPFIQTDWPNPYPVQWYQTWAQSLKISQPVGGPFNQKDWPNPQPVQFYRELGLNLLQSTLAVSRPFSQTDWPVPVYPSRIDQTWIQFQTPPQPTGGPFNQFDWPIPKTPQPIDQTWTQESIKLTFTPFAQRDWPNPYPVTWSQSWTQSLVLPQPVGGPFNQFDWPTPKDYLRIEETWVQSPKPQLPGTPFAQRDWPNPYPVQWYKDWAQSLSIPQPIGGPFNEYDWPVPKGPTPIDQTWIQEAIKTTLAPFFQLDWPNPQQYFPIFQSWVNDLPPGVLATLGTPFNQTDWPVPTAPARIDQFWIANSNFLPPPTPPSQSATGGRQISEAEVTAELRGWWDKVLNTQNGIQGLSEFSQRGGFARANALTATQRTVIATQGARARWG